MVREKKPTKRRIKRKSSWKDTLKGFTNGREDVVKRSRSHASLSRRDLPDALGMADEGSLADAESDDEDFGEVKEEDRPIEDRVVYKYANGGGNVSRNTSALEKQQQELSIAVAEADCKAIKSVGGKSPSSKEPIGTRLTMTSRTGYFQDRIISPSMVRVTWNRQLLDDNFFRKRCVQWLFCISGPTGILISLRIIIYHLS